MFSTITLQSISLLLKYVSCESCPPLCLPTAAPQTPLSVEFSKEEDWRGQPFPSAGTFPSQELNAGLLHCRQCPYHLSNQGIPSTKDTFNYFNSKSPKLQTFIFSSIIVFLQLKIFILKKQCIFYTFRMCTLPQTDVQLLRILLQTTSVFRFLQMKLVML